MFGISGTELIIILFFGFLIFGPEKLPQMGRTVGRAIRQFRDASEAANKKFKEEVADPFQDAIAPYKDQIDASTKPIQDDLAAINNTFNETKSMFSDPFKDMLKPTVRAENKVASGAVVTGALADDSAPQASRLGTPSTTGDDPFAEVFEEKAETEAKPIPDSGGTVVVKKSLASSLYDLDDEDGA